MILAGERRRRPSAPRMAHDLPRDVMQPGANRARPRRAEPRRQRHSHQRRKVAGERADHQPGGVGPEVRARRPRAGEVAAKLLDPVVRVLAARMVEMHDLRVVQIVHAGGDRSAPCRASGRRAANGIHLRKRVHSL